jgi:hypothetical protein
LARVSVTALGIVDAYDPVLAEEECGGGDGSPLALSLAAARGGSQRLQKTKSGRPDFITVTRLRSNDDDPRLRTRL